jgi:hypothetical protein
MGKVIVRTSFTPPVELDVAGGTGAPTSESDGEWARAALNVLRPSVEHVGTGIRVEPWGAPTDWKIPLAVVLLLAGYGALKLWQGK